MPSRLQTLSTVGRYFFGSAIVASGAMQLFRGEFVRLVPKLPAGTPWADAWPEVTGVILVIAGGLIIAGRYLRVGAAAISLLLLAVLALRVPEIAAKPGTGFVWTNPCKVLALLGGAILLGALKLNAGSRVRWCRAFLATFLIVAGVQHFVYATFVHTLVPAWMPMPPAWTYITGVTLFAGGVGLLLPRTAPLAGAWAGLMIFLWVLMLHLPRALIDPRGAFELAGVFEALALSGVALLAIGGPATGPSNSIP
jgi:uncharacterized membrane protein